MILIADCGGTKCDWAIVDGSDSRIFTSRGFNPMHSNSENITYAIKSAIQGNIDPKTIDTIYFYGAGCMGGEPTEKVEAALKYFFTNADIIVNNDLLGAARAIFKNDNGIAAIIGTGCNSGLYQNGEIVTQIPPMGYILGDEGSGASIGKRLVNAIYKLEITDNYRQLFEKETMIGYRDVIEGTYKSENPAQFLAQFVPFIQSHINDTIFRNLVFIEFDLFFNRNILRIPGRPKAYTIGFVGSVAAVFEDILRDVARFHGISVCSVYKNPIDRLVEFHQEMQGQI